MSATVNRVTFWRRAPPLHSSLSVNPGLFLMPLNSRLQRGFSLAEVLATVAVAGVLTAAAVPSFQSVIGESHRAAAINQLVSAMHLLRSEAITQNARGIMCPGTDGANCEDEVWSGGWFAFVDRNGNGSRDDDELLIATGAADPRIDITTGSFADALVYRPNGRIVLADAGATSGNFVICDNREVSLPRVIIVPRQGHPRLSEKHAGGLAPTCP